MKKLDLRMLLIAIALFASFACAADEAAKAEKVSPPAIVHGPYLTAPRPDSMTIAWFTNQKCLSWVEYGETTDCLAKASSSHFGLIDAFDTRHVVLLEGLKPGTTYYYRVVSKEIVRFGYKEIDFGAQVAGKTCSFRTLAPAKDHFSFCAVADNHEDSKRLGGMFDKIDWGEVDFVVLDGDMVTKFETEPQFFDGFLDVCVAKFATGIPFIYVRGNHETRGPLARRLYEYAPTPEGRFHYSFDHGGVHFVVMDSGENRGDEDKGFYGMAAFDAYRTMQTKWLQEEIASDAWRKATFRIALMHIPIRLGSDDAGEGPLAKANIDPSGDKGHGSRQIRGEWEPLLNQGGVDLVISGHLHKNAHIVPRDGANRYDQIIIGQDDVLRVDVTCDRLSVRWDPKDKSVADVPKAFERRRPQ
jgi:phosphodiesterase/alkaline phosphatase D-like protein